MGLEDNAQRRKRERFRLLELHVLRAYDLNAGPGGDEVINVQ